MSIVDVWHCVPRHLGPEVRSMCVDFSFAAPGEAVELAREIRADKHADYMYRRVARVDCRDVERERVLDSAYEWTNSIHDHWIKNRQVLSLYGGTQHRSTSVGDLLIEDDGSVHLVVGFGFHQL